MNFKSKTILGDQFCFNFIYIFIYTILNIFLVYEAIILRNKAHLNAGGEQFAFILKRKYFFSLNECQVEM